MFDWASSIIAAAVITAIAVFIIPDTEHGKQISVSIRFIGALLSLCLIISPIPEILKSISSFFDIVVTQGENDGSNENYTGSDLVFNEALKNFEKQTFDLTTKKLGRSDFSISAQADKALTDITVNVTYYSEDFPVETICGYLLYLYSDSVKVNANYSGQHSEEKTDIMIKEDTKP